MRTVLRTAVLTLLVVAGCTEPSYVAGQLQCSPHQECPAGFFCGVDNHCWDRAVPPDFSEPAPDGGSAIGDMAVGDMAVGDMAVGDMAVGDMALPLCSTLICDDFESGTIGNFWAFGATHGAIGVDQQHAHSGTSALHVHNDAVLAAEDSNVAIYGTHGFPLSSTIYARAWVYIKSPYPGPFTQLFNLVDASGGGAALAMNDQYAIFNGYTAPQSWGQDNTHPIPVDQWVCLQMRYDQGAASGTAGVSIDGVEYIAVNAVATNAMVGIYFGSWFFNHPDLAASDLWYDDIVVDDKPVPCSAGARP
jgi:hypothetical protein